MRLTRLIPILVLSVLGAGCSSFFHAAAATVDGHPISVALVQDLVASQVKQNPTAGQSPEAQMSLERSVVAELIRRQLLADFASTKGIVITGKA
ncbi:MAG: SurA N-terminal domain-containing protein, partial [Actinobacteria bacterium]|nr:SurA N-terminal domain-containing protein [Actinomycetota bacterium]